METETSRKRLLSEENIALSENVEQRALVKHRKQDASSCPSDVSSSANINGYEQASKKFKKRKNGGKSRQPQAKRVRDSLQPENKQSADIVSSPIDVNPATLPSSLSKFSNGDETFSWLIHPYSPDKFFQKVWQKKPLFLLRENKKDHFKELMSTKELDSVLRSHVLRIGESLRIVRCVNGKRETLKHTGRAFPGVVKKYFDAGWSVQVLRPQAYVRSLCQLCGLLQELMGTLVGVNAYLTPPGEQGFAPHYDDIEAFVLQLEGEKEWMVYEPRSKNRLLPHEPGKDIPATKLNKYYKQVAHLTLKPGDLLYFPRGFVHHAKAVGETHSLHLTLSCYQNTSWGNYLSKMLPSALDTAIHSDVRFRQGLPIGYMNYMGIAHQDAGWEHPLRAIFKKVTTQLMQTVVDNLPYDVGADMMATQYLKEALPPVLPEGQMKQTVWGCGGLSGGPVRRLTVKSRVRLLAATVARVVVQEDKSILMHYHSDNSLLYSSDPVVEEVDIHVAVALEFLSKSYPKFVHVKNIPVTDQLDTATFLWEMGLLVLHAEDCKRQNV